MATKNKHSLQSKPQAAQVAAVRNLLLEAQYDQARLRLGRLIKDFPCYRPLFALAWEIEDDEGAIWPACARAYDWVQAAPTSADALTALTNASFDAGLVALGAQSAAKFKALRGEASPPLPDQLTPLGRMTADEMVLTDISRLLLADGRYAQIDELLKDALHPSLRNNRAVALFARADIAAALPLFETSWQQAPSNTFALERVVRLRIWRDGRAGLQDLAQALRASVPQRAEDAVGKLFGLILLGEWDAAEACWQADAGSSQDSAQGDRLAGLFAYAGTVLALRAGDIPAATERLRLARNAIPQHEPTAAIQAAMQSAEPANFHAEIGEVGAWLPSSWLLRLRNMRTTKADLERRVEQHLAACDAHPEYLGLAAELGGPSVGGIAVEVLKARARGGDVPATEQLKSILTRPCGTDRQRVDLLNWLARERLIDPATPSPMLANGNVARVKAVAFALTSNPTSPMPYRPAAHRRCLAMYDLIDQGRLDEALVAANEVCSLAPAVPMSHANVATVREAIDERDTEVEAGFRRALELDDDYLIARAGLARVLARHGDLDAASAMLAPSMARPLYHYSEWRAILRTQRAISHAAGQNGAVAAIDEQLRELARMERE